MTPRTLIRGITLAGLALTGGGLAFAGYPEALFVMLGIAAALFSIRVGQQGEVRYGRRVPVTEMFALGRQGDRQMLLGGLAGYVMLACFMAAGWLAFL